MQQFQPVGPYAVSRPPKWLWALPVFSCGLLSVVPLFVIAAKAKTPQVWRWAGGLAATWFFGFALVGTQPEGSDNLWSDLGGMIYIASWIGTIVFALVMGPKVDWAPKAMYVPVGPPPYDPNSTAVAGVRARRVRQEEARAMVRQDPQMARDLRIGRPDLPRQYDDGGLVDVNSAPAEVMTQWLGLTAAQSAQVVGAREQLGRFEHVEDLVNLAGLEPTTHDQIKDRIILM